MELSGSEPESFGLEIADNTTVLHCVSCLPRKIVFSPSVHFSSRHSVENQENRNARFNRSVFHIHVNEVSFCTKSISLYNFVILFLPLSRTVFEMRKLTPQFSTRWRWEKSHSVAHIQFTIPIHHGYKNSSNRSEIQRVTRDFSGILYICVCIYIYTCINITGVYKVPDPF